jgi:hypothetical protein
MQDCQFIRVETDGGKMLDVLVVKEPNGKFSVTMSLTAFYPPTAGFSDAKVAVQAAFRALNAVLVGEKLKTLINTTGEFVSAADVRQLI